LSIYIHAIEKDIIRDIQQWALSTDNLVKIGAAAGSTVTIRSADAATRRRESSYISEIVIGPISTSYPALVGP
jgi:hypothetical protein